jgi:hypothetical protein
MCGEHEDILSRREAERVAYNGLWGASLGRTAIYGVGGNCEKGGQTRNFRPRFEVQMNSAREKIQSLRLVLSLEKERDTKRCVLRPRRR